MYTILKTIYINLEMYKCFPISHKQYQKVWKIQLVIYVQ